MVKGQYWELVFCPGELALSPEYERFAVPVDLWYAREEKYRKHHFQRFTTAVKGQCIVRTTDGNRTVRVPTHGGKNLSHVRAKRSDELK